MIKDTLKSWGFWFLLGLGMLVIGILFNSNFIGISGLVIMLLVGAIAMIFGWIINPINSYCSKHNKVIKKGFHRPLFQIPLCLPRIVNLNKEISFLIDLTDTETSSNNHLNKLFGITIGFFIHKNSFRFTYSEINKELYAYYYIDGKREYKSFKLYNNGIGRAICRIKKNNDFVSMIVGIKGKKETINIPFKNTSKYGFRTGLYYGGKIKAPHKVNIFIEKL